ncbi:hypothetical protein EDB86DRAFT_1624149 [Lactarius hatsudake]|nr:hypothetical protein EDB86DRAFT_1624149 [Lactarius hatsudake]
MPRHWPFCHLKCRLPLTASCSLGAPRHRPFATMTLFCEWTLAICDTRTCPVAPTGVLKAAAMNYRMQARQVCVVLPTGITMTPWSSSRSCGFGARMCTICLRWTIPFQLHNGVPSGCFCTPPGATYGIPNWLGVATSPRKRKCFIPDREALYASSHSLCSPPAKIFSRHYYYAQELVHFPAPCASPPGAIPDLERKAKQ